MLRTIIAAFFLVSAELGNMKFGISSLRYVLKKFFRIIDSIFYEINNFGHIPVSETASNNRN